MMVWPWEIFTELWGTHCCNKATKRRPAPSTARIGLAPPAAVLLCLGGPFLEAPLQSPFILSNTAKPTSLQHGLPTNYIGVYPLCLGTYLMYNRKKTMTWPFQVGTYIARCGGLGTLFWIFSSPNILWPVSYLWFHILFLLRESCIVPP
jgi:hypothetical protein